MTEAEQRQAVVSAALAYENCLWVHMGRTQGGIDCGGLIICSYYTAGLIPWIETGYYPKDHMLHRDEEVFLGWVEKFARKVDREPLPGDIALYHFGRCISHGGIVVDWPTIIHAVAKSQAVVRGDGDKGELASRLAGFWSLREWS